MVRDKMSKKKATMTLKDFHGGSIPSDLPLPSAPGVIVRPVDRGGGFDRQTSWGNSMGRPDLRLRPASAGSARNLDDKAPFLNHSSHIGRNFDEDERKPLDGVLTPRRTVVDESIRAQPTRSVRPKMDNLSDAIVGSRATSVSASPVSSGKPSSSHSGRLGEVHNVGMNNQNISGSRNYGSNYPNKGGSAGQPVSGSHRNAWGIRKETVSLKEPVSAPWSAPDAATKLAHASALEKVFSGRWNPKQQVHTVKDAEVSGLLETEGESLHKTNITYNKNKYDRLDVAVDTGYHDVSLVMHAERSLAIEGGIDSGAKEMPTYERVRSTVQVESYERKSPVNANGSQVPRPIGKSSDAEFPPTLPSESTDRPKLKLLPRSKPLESLETQLDYKQAYQQPSDHLPVEDSYAVHQPTNPAQSGFTGSVIVDQAVDRPKLNLRPRSQPLEQSEVNTGIKRGTVFGGARPRELVLKERGIDDFAVGNYENQSPMRVKEDAPKMDTSIHVAPVRYAEKAENVPVDQRITKYSDKRVQRPDIERNDSLRRNRRNEKVEKHRNQQQQLQPQDRPPSPETWRKPIERATPASPNAPPVRYGKAASALELAQAFSKPASDPKLADRFSGHRGLPRGGQVPFSRLMGPTLRPQINGY